MSTRRQVLSNMNRQTIANHQPHLGLWLDKYLVDQNSKGSLVDDVSSLSKTSEMYKLFYEQWKTLLKSYGAVTQIATVKGRMIVGLGSESVLETAVTLHRTYGIPYIPGSALKGLAASYAKQKLGEKWQRGETDYKVVFGDMDEAGYITFFDALYIPDREANKYALYPDIITVHHPKYYQNTSNAPADWDSPTPIPFLSATGSYLLALAAPDLQKLKASLAKEWIDATFDILEKALNTLGIGAKTSSGYGRMEFEIDQSGPGMEEVQAFQQKLDSIPVSTLTSRFDGLFAEWNKLPSNKAKVIAAKAIIQKIENTEIEQTMASRPKYKVLKSFEADR